MPRPSSPPLSLVRNPRASVQLERGRGGRLTEVWVEAPTRTRGFLTAVFRRKDDRLVVGEVEQLLSGQGAGLSPEVLARLWEAGLLIGPDEQSDEVRFRCALEDTRPGAEALLRAGGALRVNPGLELLERDGGPEWSELVDLFGPDTERAVLVPDPVTDVPWAYTASPATFDLLRRVPPGAPPGRVPAALRRKLIECAVLLPSGAPSGREDWRQRLDAAADALARNGYANVAGIFPRPILAAARRYFNALIQEGYLPLGDSQSLRFFRHNDAVARALHLRLAAVAADVFGKRLKPSYAFFGSYRPGADLPAHRDRRQCKYSATLQLDFEPAPERVTPWPIRFKAPGRRRFSALHQALGDCAFYLGCDVLHERKKLSGGQLSSHIFFHYVDSGFRGALD